MGAFGSMGHSAGPFGSASVSLLTSTGPALDPAASCGGGFGSTPHGSGPFGSGSAFELVSVVQETLNSVLVTFGSPPVSFDSASIFSATNASNWTLEPRNPPGTTGRLAQWAERVDALTIRVLFDGPLDAPATYRLRLNTRVVDVYGLPLSGACSFLDFDTVPPTRLAPQATRAEDPTDLNNPSLVADADLLDPPPLGTFQINDRGDYALERGRPYLRKRVLRRATTLEGEFFHLPTYGFAEPIKGTIRPDLLRRLQAKAQAQILREPDVVDSTVRARFAGATTPNIVILEIKVTDRYGRTEELTVPITLRSPG